MTNKFKNIVLITNGFPFGSTNETFLENEISYLGKSSENIKIISKVSDKKIKTKQRKIPKNSCVQTFYTKSTFLQKIKLLFIFIGKIPQIVTLFQKEIIASKRNNSWRFSNIQIAFHELLKAYEFAEYIKQNFKDYDKQSTLYYSYWLNSSALALAILKYDKIISYAISRGHGSDIYDNLHPRNYLAHRTFILNSLDKFFSVSNHGAKYLKDRYSINDKIETSRLGTKELIQNPKMNDINNRLIVSCSNIKPVKRIEDIIQVLSKTNTQNLTWIHFGGGDGLQNIKNLAEQKLSNISFKIVGPKSNQQVIDFYLNNHVSLLINLSSSEGIPVSMMEAMSLGVPVLATDVGGVSEIVNSKTGFLVNPKINHSKTARIIDDFFNLNTKARDSYSSECLKMWKHMYDRNKNYNDFITRINRIKD